MKQTPKSIFSFEKGDLITRVIPSRPYPNMIGTEVPDYSYIGIKLEFVGILNGCIFFKKEESYNLLIDIITAPLLAEMSEEERNKIKPKETLLSLPLTIWEEGWVDYIDPKSFFGIKEDVTILNSKDEIQLNKELKKAIAEDDFERAEKLQKRIDQIKKKGKNNL